MSYISGDRFDEPFFVEKDFEPHRCERCAKSLSVEGSDYCLACGELEAAEEAAATVALPILQPIPERPVELNAVLWQEWKRLAEKL
jgi:hypothetical protein